jgi:hypothetical protein
MGISKGKYSEKNLGVASYSLISPSGVEREENVDLGSHWRTFSCRWWKSLRY